MSDDFEDIKNLKLEEFLKTGTTFDVKVDSDSDKHFHYDDNEYSGKYTNLECDLHFENTSPFEYIAESMESLTPDGRIKKKIIRQGYGERPSENDVVKVNFNAYIENEVAPFDSTYFRKKPYFLKIKDECYIKGLLLAVQSMKLAEKSQFLIHPDLAYRDSGLTRIPPNSTVLFEIEISDISLADHDEENAEADAKDFIKIHDECLVLNEMAKTTFKKQDFRGACKMYKDIITKLECAPLEDYKDQIKYDNLLMRLLTNLLLCHTRLNEPKKGCIAFNEMMHLSKNGNVKLPAKAYFNGSKCLGMLGEMDEAHSRMKKALAMQPNNKEIKDSLKNLE